MPTVNKEIMINAPLEGIFNYVNKPSNLPQIWPSFIGVKNEQLLPNGGFRFHWTYKMAGIPLEGRAEYTDIVPNLWFTCKTYGAVDSTITWTFRSKEMKTKVTISINYWVPMPIIGPLAEAILLKTNEKETELILENLRIRFETKTK